MNWRNMYAEFHIAVKREGIGIYLDEVICIVMTRRGIVPRLLVGEMTPVM